MSHSHIDHLFRHQYGKMVSVLTRIFGLQHIETVEDAVQDTFISAIKSWRNEWPDQPEAWLMKAAKNRVIDLFRKIDSEHLRQQKFDQNMAPLAISELFLNHEVEDSQLRMIFTACHPALDQRDQIAFALKTISGFSAREISSAFLAKEETIKKRLSRARKTIKSKEMAFAIPIGKDLPDRLNRVLKVLYLIFNEGFHSNRSDVIVRSDLCYEAMRLCKMVLKNQACQKSSVYALLGLMCFHAARLSSKIGTKGEFMDLKNQDRSMWDQDLYATGDMFLTKAVQMTTEFSNYHIEAAIAFEHMRASTFEETNWKVILHWHLALIEVQAHPFNYLNTAIVYLQLKDMPRCVEYLNKISPEDLGQRLNLYHGTWAEYHYESGNLPQAIDSLNQAISTTTNEIEKNYLLEKMEGWGIKGR